jgi:hypothetical protein
MVTLPPYEKDRTLYHKLPAKDRWIFNKLDICERFGYEPCGPCGTPMPEGTYCIRPVINVLGMADGGFRKMTVKDGHIIYDLPGYCWTPWDNGKRMWSEYINDVCTGAQQTYSFNEKTGVETFIEVHPTKRMKMPEQLKGISRYMLIETIGDTVIDIGARHMSEDARQSTIDDYKKNVDPFWEVPDHIEFGISEMLRVYNPKTKMYSYKELPNMHSWKFSQ